MFININLLPRMPDKSIRYAEGTTALDVVVRKDQRRISLISITATGLAAGREAYTALSGSLCLSQAKDIINGSNMLVRVLLVRF
jgi:hypothetical protein